MHLAGGRLGDAAAESEAAIAAAAAVGADAYVSAACSLLGIITLRQGDLQAAASYVADCPVPLSSAAAVRRRLHGRARMVVDEDHGCLLGVTMIGPGIEELLHSATVAVAGQVPVSRLWHAVPAFPPSARSGSDCSRPAAADRRNRAVRLRLPCLGRETPAGPTGGGLIDRKGEGPGADHGELGERQNKSAAWRRGTGAGYP